MENEQETGSKKIILRKDKLVELYTTLIANCVSAAEMEPDKRLEGILKDFAALLCETLQNKIIK